MTDPTTNDRDDTTSRTDPAADPAVEPTDGAGAGAGGGAREDRAAAGGAPRSDLEQGLESLGRVIEGVAGRLLGPKAVGREELPTNPTFSKETDEALRSAGDDLGRLLHAAGEALKDHPLDPKAAATEAKARVSEPPVADPGWSPLSTGLRSLGEGLFKVAEGVLDQVAPRKPKKGGGGPVDAAPADPSADSPQENAEEDPDEAG